MIGYRRVGILTIFRIPGVVCYRRVGRLWMFQVLGVIVAGSDHYVR